MFNELLFQIGVVIAVFFLGVFSSQWVKDKISGVPSDLRLALKAAQAAALRNVQAAQAKAVADATSAFTKAAVSVAPPKTPLVPYTPAAPAPPLVSSAPLVPPSLGG
jgi:Tfp pilus assembly protein PilX